MKKENNKTETSLVLQPTTEFISRRIHIVRDQKVMLDSELADLYQVSTKVLNQAVQRNIGRFPNDFRFKLTELETQSLRSQIVTSNRGRGGRRYSPFVFTELGVAMLSSVLKSERAVQMNIFIMRTFVKLRTQTTSNSKIINKINEIELVLIKQGKDLDYVYKYIKKFMDTPLPLKHKLGYAKSKKLI